jgi:amino acid adenylation domain-containing protein/non-ribosomal peptide synthase protein (TIGR01720 family)
VNELSRVLAELSPQQRALLERRLKQHQAEASAPAAAAIPRRQDPAAWPLSFAQERFWFLDRLQPGSPLYNIPLAVRMPEPVDRPALSRSFAAVAARHEMLRATFTGVLGKPVMAVAAAARPRLPLVDLAGLPGGAREVEAHRLASREARRPFDLARGPLARATLLRLGGADHLLLLTLHHIIADGWSIELLARETSALYRQHRLGEPAALPALPIQFADFAAWQRRQLRGEALAAHLAYWRSQLAGAPAVLPLPTDRPAPAVPSFRGARQPFVLPAPLVAGLRQLGRQAGASSFMVLLTALVALLRRYTGLDDVVVGSPVANRDRPELLGLIGPLINTMVLRCDVAGDPGGSALLARVREVVHGALQHRDLPFEMLVDELRPERHLGHNPLFQVMLACDSAAPGDAVARPVRAASPLAGETGSAKFALGFEVEDAPSGIGGVLEYGADLFDRCTITRLLGHFETVLAGLVAAPGLPLSALPLPSGAERHQLLHEWNDSGAAPRHAQPVHRLFEAQAARTPRAAAVLAAGQTLSYAELNEQANQLAHRLIDLGLGRGALAAIYVERSAEMLIGVLAVLKSGGAYLPIDAAYPEGRVELLLRASRAAVVVTRQGLARRLSGFAGKVVPLDRAALGRGFGARNPEVPIAALDLAYVIYTSGSTGQPKGVMVSHRGFSHYLAFAVARYAGRGGVVAPVASPLSFDLTVTSLFTPLLAGGTVHLLPEEGSVAALAAELAAGRQDSLWKLTPSHLQLVAGMLPPAAAGPATMVVGGEALTAESFAGWGEALAHTRIVNEYGPTETVVGTCVYELAGRALPRTGPVPIGRPIAGARALVVDREGGLAALGVPGELWLGGPGVARGYLGQPALTAAAFVPDPFGAEPGGRLYRTGDRVRTLADGNLEFCGRMDEQLKIRGYRIEPAEIEAALRSHPAVAEAVAVARVDPAGQPSLVAYLLPAPGEAPAAAELRGFLARRLPQYMVPAAFVTVRAWPLTGNGKIDRRPSALPAPDDGERGLGERSAAPPVGAAERLIAEVWGNLLGLATVSRHANFFDLGGHSLLLLEVHSRLEQRLGRGLALIDLFRYPTVSSLGAYLSAGPGPAAAAPAPSAAAPSGSLDVAIVGMAGRFPGARDLDQFWANLRDGREGISFFSAAELAAAGVDPALAASPGYVPAAGVLADADLFDAPFFGFTPREAAITDPQHRIFLECAWEALESAGYDPARCDVPVGVFAGASMNSYLANLVASPEVVRAGSALQTMLGNDKDFVPTRVSYKLDLRGPSVAVQTACSSSLVAVHLACQSLLRGECGMALAGGVSVAVPQVAGYVYEEGDILSPDGHCRAFDAAGRGTVTGSGAGVVVLKRLGDALRDRDTIAAVIRASAINNDGGLKMGFTAPSEEGQAAVIREALAKAGVAPETVSYVEAHGTATALGDPVEVAALTRAFRARTDRRGFCALGSVKTNIGHLDAAAGVAGLIKTALALRHGALPPSLHFAAPNPHIDFAASPFYVNRELRPWPRGATPRRAGVSSFGMGGTNAHLIVEEPPPACGEEEAPPPAPAAAGEPAPAPTRLLVLSARSAPALAQAAARLGSYLRQPGAADLADIAYTLQVGRHAFDHRLVAAGRDAAEAARALAGGDAALLARGTAGGRRRPLAFLFPGQGAQAAGMGREIYRREPRFREEIDRCAELAAPLLGSDLRELLYPAPERQAAAAAALRRTALAQPALFAVEIALARLWMSWGVEPEALIGHSLGELVAACLAGVFTLEAAVLLVVRRAALMEGLPAGAMAAVALSGPELAPYLGDEVCLAAVNSPRQCVIAGPLAAVAACEQRLAAAGVAAKRLAASHAFHSAMTEPILAAFGEEVARANPRAPRLPFVSNVTGRWATAEETVRPDYWVRQLRQPVLFSAGLAELLADPDRVLLEVGPGRSLANLVHRQPGAGDRLALSSLPLDAAASAAAVPPPLTALAQLWVAGGGIHWPGLYERTPRRVPLPTYPFERRRHWVEPGGEGGRDAWGHRAPWGPRDGARRPDPADWFFLPAWRRALPPEPAAAGADGGPRRCLLLLDGDGLGSRLGERLRALGTEAVGIRADTGAAGPEGGEPAIDLRRPEEIDALLARLAAAGQWPGTIVHLASLAAGLPREPLAMPVCEALDLGFSGLLHLAQALGRRTGAAPLRLLVVTRGLQAVTGDEALCPERSTLFGICQVLSREYPHVTCLAVDLPAAPPGSAGEDEAIGHLLAELLAPPAPAAPAVAWRGGQRWLRSFEPVRLPAGDGRPAALRERGVYLITGGLGGIGLEIAGYLARAAAARLVLVGRRPLPPRERWHGDGDRRLARLLALEEAGAEVLALAADAADLAAMRGVVAAARQRFGAVHGVIHAAGLPGGGLLQLQTRERVAAVVAPKLAGARVLDALFGVRELDFLLLCSSLISLAADPGRADYCAANAFLDAFAHERSRRGRPTLAVNWDTWNETGMAADAAVRLGRVPGPGLGGMSSAEGIEAFRRLVGLRVPQLAVSTRDLATVVELAARPAAPAAAAPPAGAASAAPGAAGGRQPSPAAPRNEAERILAEIWQGLLGVHEVGIHDRFGDLGGDSVLSIQVAARARQAGLELSLEQLFAHQTIAELAAVVGAAPAADAEQGTVTGAVPLTPMQHWFFARPLLHPGHFNQSLLLAAPPGLDPARLARALGLVLAQHDALRLRFAPGPSGWEQRHAAPAATSAVAVLDLAAVAAALRGAALTRAAATLQASLRLTAGPLVRLALFRLGPGTAERLLLVVHHLVVDVVSWRIVLEDLETAYRQLAGGGPVRLAAKTTSFKRWAERLHELAAAPEVAAEADYWLAGSRALAVALPRDLPGGANTVASARLVHRELAVQETAALVQEVQQLHQADLREIVLASLAVACTHWTGEPLLAIEIEGHGREAIAAGVDLSRTVGWFTTSFPLLLDLTRAGAEPRAAVAAVKERLRAVPRRGLGYGLLRYLSPAAETRRRLQSLPHPEIAFLYLGSQFDQGVTGPGLFTLAAEPAGPEQAGGDPRPAVLEVTGAVTSGRLSVTIGYSANLHLEPSIARLADRVMELLRTLIARCREAEEWRHAPSPFAHANVSRGELAELLAELPLPEGTA